ncbi:MAG: response regulator transcription factor [Acidobacteria bacterium]|nr:response regulator transcription factor [Acidobacteriota bacterium]MCI0723282.1 response regulator transcription factor [Acidobacteriota bacterium]
MRILVADDHELIRQGARKLLEAQTGWEICGEASTGREAIEKAKELKPDVVVLDLSMPDLNGLEATRQIVKALPQTQVLILTLHESEELIHDVLDAGAHGYLLKSDAARNLVLAMEALGQHNSFFSCKVSKLVLEGYLHGCPHEDLSKSSVDSLTPREREIVQLLAEGKSNKEVASVLNLSVYTVVNHRTNIMRKLDIHSVTELVLYAVRNKIIQP